MSLLDPTAISDPDDYTPDDFRRKGLVIRRFKKDIRDQVSADFQERQTICLRRALVRRKGPPTGRCWMSHSRAHKAGRSASAGGCVADNTRRRYKVRQ